MRVLIGVKPGQRHESSAFCVAERSERETAGVREVHFVVRFLERVPAGTRIPDLAARVGELVLGSWKKGASCSHLYVDITGLGQPLVEIFKSHSHGIRVTPVYFNYGDRREADAWPPQVRLGKAYLVTRLVTILQVDRLHLPRNPQAETLADELQRYEIRLPPDANDRHGAFSVGTHDDLVTALGLAVQDDDAPKSGWMRAW